MTATLAVLIFVARLIQGHDDLEPVAVLAGKAEYEFTRVVARVERKADGSALCTAARVGDGLFLTNFHCDEPCSGLQFRMGYVEGAQRSQQTVWRCTRLVHKELRFDYALYAAEPLGPTDFPVLPLWVGPLRDGQRLLAASHPTGRPLQVDRSPGCKVIDATPFLSAAGRMNIKHGCDTEVSSSGTPLLDRQTGYGVALHWGGLDDYNEAIPMSLVVKSLREHAPAVIPELTLEGG